jgi:hypothetical protein
VVATVVERNPHRAAAKDGPVADEWAAWDESRVRSLCWADAFMTEFSRRTSFPSFVKL